MPDQVEIVILTCNKKEYTGICLDSIKKSTYRPLRILLVDNGSTDGTVSMLNEFKKKALDENIDVCLRLNSENIGAVAGRNSALQELQGDYTVFLDNDVMVPEKGWLEKMLAFFKNTEDTGAVSPKLIYPVEPFLIQCAGCDVAPSGRVNFRGRGEDRSSDRFNRPEEVQALITACMMTSKSVIDEVGEFDERFSPVQFEDIDYCYRIKQTGRRLFYYPDVEVYHFENVTTSGTESLNPAYNTVKNGMKFKEKWHHVFSRENGPEESQMVWKDVQTVDFSNIELSELERY